MPEKDTAWLRDQKKYRHVAYEFADEIARLPIEQRTKLWHLFWHVSPGRAIRDGRALVALREGSPKPA